METAIAAPKAILAGKITGEMSFNEKVWALCTRVPEGKVTTYGAIAKDLGVPKGARAVGNALNRNPYAPEVPCHRVVGSNRTLTGYAGGLAAKRKILMEEGIKFDGERVMADCLV